MQVYSVVAGKTEAQRFGHAFEAVWTAIRMAHAQRVFRSLNTFIQNFAHLGALRSSARTGGHRVPSAQDTQRQVDRALLRTTASSRDLDAQGVEEDHRRTIRLERQGSAKRTTSLIHRQSSDQADEVRRHFAPVLAARNAWISRTVMRAYMATIESSKPLKRLQVLCDEQRASKLASSQRSCGTFGRRSGSPSPAQAPYLAAAPHCLCCWHSGLVISAARYSSKCVATALPPRRCWINAFLRGTAQCDSHRLRTLKTAR